MPPHTLTSDAASRLLYVLTTLAAAGVVLWAGLAGAGPVDPQCRGNSPHKICPKLTPSPGDTVSGQVLVNAEAPETVVGVTFAVDDTPLALEDIAAPYEIAWDTTKLSDGDHRVSATARDATGKTSMREHVVTVSNSTSSPTPPSDTTDPSVQLTSPASGATVSGQVGVSADASDDVGVVGVQFRLDGAALGSEDTSAPYAVSWDTTKVADGSHTLTAVARDAAGNSSSSQRSVTVSNLSSSQGDTTAPTLAFTNPAAGATISGAVAVSATASDDVGVVGVQFRIDGAALGSEDTSAPYAVSWDTTKVADGSHTLTAVARDAAGNSSTSQRVVTVSNSTSSGPKLTWAPPALSNPMTINVTNANRRLYLDNSRDYRLNVTESLKRELWIDGGRNVVVIGGHITIDALGGDTSYQDNTAVKIRGGASGGTVHLEGILIDGAYVLDGIALATPRDIQIQNVRIERATTVKGNHPDCLQTQAGAGAIRIDRFTCTTDLQGIFLRDDLYAIGPSDFRHVNIAGSPGKHLFWQTTPKQPVSLTDVWLHMDSPWGPFGWWVYPNSEGKTWDGKTDMSRIAVVSADGSYLTFSGSTNTISGRINKGRPPSGDFVPRSVVGTNYSSPGYS